MCSNFYYSALTLTELHHYDQSKNKQGNISVTIFLFPIFPSLDMQENVCIVPWRKYLAHFQQYVQGFLTNFQDPDLLFLYDLAKSFHWWYLFCGEKTQHTG